MVQFRGAAWRHARPEEPTQQMRFRFTDLALPARLGALLLPLLLPMFASASTYSFPGASTSDDQVQLFAFQVPLLTLVTLQTFGYAGGTNGNGQPVP